MEIDKGLVIDPNIQALEQAANRSELFASGMLGGSKLTAALSGILLWTNSVQKNGELNTKASLSLAGALLGAAAMRYVADGLSQEAAEYRNRANDITETKRF